jgi:hypothetical protein
MNAMAPRVARSLLLLAVAGRGAAQSGSSAGRDAETRADARVIIDNAIARRSTTLSRVRQCRYDAFVKVVARDMGEPQDSASSVLLFTQARSSAYWEHPDRYQETIEVRHQSSDAGVRRQLVSVREIAHFVRNRIELEEGVDASREGSGGRPRSALGRNEDATNRYSLVSPIADDALEHYEFAVVDTLLVNGRRIFRVAVRPKSEAAPLFSGTVDIADSTYDVVTMDLGVNDAVRFSAVSALRYQQRWRDVGDGEWMPTEVRLSGEVRPKISARWLPRKVAGIPLPEFPKRVSFEQVATLADFRLEPGDRPADLAEYRAVVGDQADRADSGIWSAPEAAPLTPAESAAWLRADSLKRHPALLPRLSRDLDAVQREALGPGFFHFNRVDGAYVGGAHEWRATPGVIFTTKLGYALGSEMWQYRVGGHVLLSGAHRLWVGAAYHDETVGWPALVPSGYDPTASALVARVDPSDYYREHGYTLSLGVKLLDFTRLEVRYDDARQWTQDTVPGPGFGSTRRPGLPNPPIQDGQMRSVSGILTYDSRQLLRSRGVDYRLSGANWTCVTLGAEVAAPSVIATDFSFRRYSLQLERQQQTLGLGTSTLTLAGGVATHGAPPQRYFTVGYGMQVLAADGKGFNTLARTAFAGNRALMLSGRHDFGRRLFARSGLPILRSIPASLALHGGVFWADLRGNTARPADSLLTTAPTPYAEWGFTLGHLTPFLSPLDLAVSFTWQISSYPTHAFRLGFGITGP